MKGGGRVIKMIHRVGWVTSGFYFDTILQGIHNDQSLISDSCVGGGGLVIRMLHRLGGGGVGEK